jgi:uncharacterized protein (TIRG00374 family)
VRHLGRWYVYGPIGAAILALLLIRTKPWDAFAALDRADLRPLILVVALNLVIVTLWAVRSKRVLVALGTRLSTTTLWPIVNFANTVNGLTPGSAGEVVRAMYLNRRFGIPYLDGVASILIERFYALYLIGLTTLAAIVAEGGPSPIRSAAAIAIIAASFVPIAIYRTPLRFSAIATAIARRSPIARRMLQRLAHELVSVEDRLGTVIRSSRAVLEFVVTTFLVFAVMDLQLLAVGWTTGVDINPVVGWVALGLGAIAGTLSALPFGLGAADATIAAILILNGVPAAEAGLITIVLRLTATLPTSILGVLSYIYLSRTSGMERRQSSGPA